MHDASSLVRPSPLTRTPDHARAWAKPFDKRVKLVYRRKASRKGACMPCVRRHWSLGVAAAVVIAGCEDQPPAAPRDDPKPSVQASARAPARPRAAAPRPATSAAANWRPQDRGELLLTAERRARIEA